MISGEPKILRAETQPMWTLPMSLSAGALVLGVYNSCCPSLGSSLSQGQSHHFQKHQNVGYNWGEGHRGTGDLALNR